MVDLSVIIASVNGFPPLRECLSSLERQQGEIDSEIIVATRCQDGTAEKIRQRFPGVKILTFAKRLSIPELRSRAMTQATGGIVVVTEDHCIASEGWFTEIVKAHQLGYMVVGGAVENGMTDRILDWSAFLCEYSSAMLPLPAGEVDDIPGNNATYKREALDLVDESVKCNLWDFFLHEALKKKGIKLLSVPSIVVIHKKRFGFVYFLSQRYHYSRSFAGMRRSFMPRSTLLFHLLGSPLLPPLMAWRITRDVVFRKRRFYKEFILSMPSLAAFLISYGVGEFVGYLLGAGGSLGKVD